MALLCGANSRRGATQRRSGLANTLQILRSCAAPDRATARREHCRCTNRNRSIRTRDTTPARYGTRACSRSSRDRENCTTSESKDNACTSSARSAVVFPVSLADVAGRWLGVAANWVVDFRVDEDLHPDVKDRAARKAKTRGCCCKLNHNVSE